MRKGLVAPLRLNHEENPIAIRTVARTPEKEPRNAVRSFLETPPTRNIITVVRIVTTMKAIRIGLIPLRNAGRSTFNSIIPVKMNEIIAFIPIHPEMHYLLL